ncbi:hypothetical protein FA15DRAFT_703211 [Coprinopsis marcescibilis]|nr:hypothetical protein FA15DRAFT_703211 [Coprinopsis marcescibilis]
MRANFIFGFVLFLFLSFGNVLAHSNAGNGNADVAARDLLEVDNLSFEAREFNDFDSSLERREMTELTTRELYEELNRRVVLIGSRMRCHLCGRMIPNWDIIVDGPRKALNAPYQHGYRVGRLQSN